MAGRTFTVTEVAGLVKDVLADAVPTSIRVVGEVSNFSDRSHWFFSLKDELATLRCVCFASKARLARFNPKDWMQVVATGRLDLYEARGDIQLYVERLEPVGQGALELQFRELCDELRRLGYFDTARKKSLPAMPRAIALVTSRSGAALPDVVNTASKRWSGCHLLLYDVHVQGASAALEVAAAINALSKQGLSLGIDALVLTRGGGSIEDLWSFNERVVAEAIFHCSLPIVAAIGHETDTTIAELVADVRCSTPTQAAMTLIPDRMILMHQVDQLAQRMGMLVSRRLERCSERLEGVARHPIFRHPQRALEPLRVHHDRLNEQLERVTRDQITQARHTLAHCQQGMAAIEPRALVRLALQELNHRTQRLNSAVQRGHQMGRNRLDALAQQLRAVDATQVLQRGYSYTLGPDGHVLRSSKAVKQGDTMTTVLSDGQLRSRVEGRARRNVSNSATPRPPSATNEAEQLGLFQQTENQQIDE